MRTAAIVALFSACTSCSTTPHTQGVPEPVSAPQRQPAVVEQTGDLAPDFINALERRNVWINSVGKGHCAGVIVSTGLVLTAKHCVGPMMYVDDKRASLLMVSEDADLALLATETAITEPIQINENPQLGDVVYSVSNTGPWRGLFSSGRVMNLRDGIVCSSVMSAPGVSGSGLYDGKGRLVGINVRMYGTTLTNNSAALLFGIAVHPKVVEQFLLGLDPNSR